MEHYSDEAHVNVGTGREMSIVELAGAIAAVVGWRGEFVFDPGKPGTPRKVMDVSRLGGPGLDGAGGRRPARRL